MDVFKDIMMSRGAPELPDFLQRSKRRQSIRLADTAVPSGAQVFSEQAAYTDEQLIAEACDPEGVNKQAGILKKMLPVDTRECIVSAQKQLGRIRDRVVANARQSFGRGVGAYADFASSIEQRDLAGEIASIRETAEVLQGLAKDLSLGNVLIMSPDVAGNRKHDEVLGECENAFILTSSNDWNECQLVLTENSLLIKHKKDIHIPLEFARLTDYRDTPLLSDAFAIDRIYPGSPPRVEKYTLRIPGSKAEWLELLNAAIHNQLHNAVSAHAVQQGSPLSPNISNIPSPQKFDEETLKKLTGWLDDLHEAIALGDYEQAVEGVDRLRYELLSSDGKHSHLFKRLARYISSLESSLLQSLRRMCMDTAATSRLVHLLQGLGRGVEARDCLLSAHSSRISSLQLLCCSGGGGRQLVPTLTLSAVVLRALAGAAAVFKKAFPDQTMASGLLIWLEAHILALAQHVRRKASSSAEFEENLLVLKGQLAYLREVGFDFEFLIK